MHRGDLGEDERAEFSEVAAVGVLVGITLLMTLSAGLYVFAADTGEETTLANFSYDYSGETDALLVRYVDGQGPPAGDVVFTDEEHSATWATLAGVRANETLAPEDAVQLTAGGSWGRPVTDVTELRVYVRSNGNRTQVSQWNASL